MRIVSPNAVEELCAIVLPNGIWFSVERFLFVTFLFCALVVVSKTIQSDGLYIRQPLPRCHITLNLYVLSDFTVL